MAAEWNPWRGHDWSSAVAEGKKLRERGHLPKEGDTIITISFGGREWTTTDREWAHGDLLPEDVAALKASMSDALLEVLERIDAVAQMTPHLFTVCTTITHPLLGRFDTPCELHRGAINLLQGPPDCRFDARFGEACSAAELMASDREKQPELSRRVRGAAGRVRVPTHAGTEARHTRRA